MDVEQAIRSIERSLAEPLPVWPGYSPAVVPLAVFDEQQVAYLNHPSPPERRPDALLAATAVEIGGVLTATLPLWMVSDPAHLRPLVYHEAFHVYQQSGGFAPSALPEGFDSNRARAFYPELDPAYRALCRAEALAYAQAPLSGEERAARLAGIALRRHAILERHPDARLLEKDAERMEGTAFHVQRMVEHLLHGRPFPPPTASSGYARVYHFGAAMCRLLGEVAGDWHTAVEAGSSPTELLLERWGHAALPPDEAWLADAGVEEARLAALALSPVDAFLAASPVCLVLPEGRAMRGFNPMTVLSLGDGRLYHPDAYFLCLPGGQLEMRQGCALEDYVANRVWIPSDGVRLVDGRLVAHTEALWLDFSGAVQSAEGTFRLT